MWKDSIRNIVVIFQPNILRIVGFYVRHSAHVIWYKWVGKFKCSQLLAGSSQYSIQFSKILMTLFFEFSSYYTTLQQCVKDMQYCEHDGIQETGHVCVWPETWVFISHWVSSFLYSIGISWSLIHRHWALTNFKLRQLVVLGLN